MLALLVGFAVVMLLPIKWAADFSDASRTGLLVCAVASIFGPVVAVLAFRLLHGGFNGFVVACLCLVGTYAAMLRVPGRSIVRFAVIVLALQIAAVFALVSFGANVGKVLLAP